MSKSITIDMLISAEVNIDKSYIQEQVTRIGEQYGEPPVFKASNQHRTLTEQANPFSEWIETKKRIKELLNQVSPQIDSEKFIKSYIEEPLSSGILDTNYYDKLFKMLIDYYKKGTPEKINNLDTNQTVKNNEQDYLLPISHELFKTILKEISSIIINILVALSVATYTSDTLEIKNYIDQKFIEYSYRENIKQDTELIEFPYNIDREEILIDKEEDSDTQNNH